MQALQRTTTAACQTPRHSAAARSVRIAGLSGKPTRFSPVVTSPLTQHHSVQFQQHLRAPSRGVACQGLFGLGLPEIAVIAGIAALVFGPSKLPELGKGLGQTVKSFQSAAKEFETELKAAAAPDEEKPATNTTEEVKKEVKKE